MSHISHLLSLFLQGDARMNREWENQKGRSCSLYSDLKNSESIKNQIIGGINDYIRCQKNDQCTSLKTLRFILNRSLIFFESS